MATSLYLWTTALWGVIRDRALVDFAIDSKNLRMRPCEELYRFQCR